MFIQSVYCRAILLVTHIFTEMQSGRADYCYSAIGELSRFVYCLLLKINSSSILPVLEKWEADMRFNRLCFAPKNTHWREHGCRQRMRT